MSQQHINNKRIAKNTLVLYARQLFSMVVSLFSSGIVLRELGVDDYGIYNVVGGVVVLLSFLQSAMMSSTQRFMNVEMGRGDFVQLRAVFSMSLKIHIFIALIVFILAETVGLWFVNYMMIIPPDRLVAANWVYQFSVFGSILAIIQTPYSAAIIANEKMNIYGYLGIAQSCASLIVLYLLVILPFDKLIQYATMVFISGIFFAVVFCMYCLKKFPECHFRNVKDRALFKEMVHFSGWNLFGSMASIGMTQGLNILLNLFFGPVVNAARGIAVQVNNAVYQFAANFMVAVNPQITKNHAIGNYDKANSLILSSAKLSFFLIFIIASPILVVTPEILLLWLKTPPEYSTEFCRLTLIDSLIITNSLPIMTGVSATGKVKKYQAIVGGCLLLNIPISYLFLKFGALPISVYFITIAISIIAMLFRVYLANKLLHFGKWNFFSNVFVRCWLLFFIAIPIEYFISTLFVSTIFNMFVIMAISVVTSAIITYLLGLTKQEKAFVVSNIKSKLLKNDTVK